MLYLAVLRAGFVYLPLNTAYQSSEIEYFIGNAEPSVVVCSAQELRLGQQDRVQGRHARMCSRSNDDRTGSLLERAASARRRAHAGAEGRRRPGRHPLHQRHHRPQQGRDADARQPAVATREVLKDYWGWQPGDVLIHALPIFHVHGLFVASHGALLNGSKMIWFDKFDPKARGRAAARGHGVHGRADAVRAPAGRAGVHARGLPQHAAVHQPARRRC